MKKLLIGLLVSLSLVGCASTGDLAKTLRYANNDPVGIEAIRFQELNVMKRGTACTWNLFYVIPMLGDGSILTAADDGEINTIELIGETGRWYFPLSKNCTVVFGDKASKD